MVQAQNPFSPPKTDPLPFSNPTVGNAVLAERGTRLGAAIIDGVLSLLALIPAMVVNFGEIQSGSQFWFFGTSPAAIASTTLWLGLMGFQAFLIAQTGQSIGKKLLGIQIVMVDGSNPGFVRGVLLRWWVLMAVSYIPVIGQFFGGLLHLIDVLMIFGDDRRCLHDKIAGTKVIVRNSQLANQ